jgi:hypothetical protein
LFQNSKAAACVPDRHNSHLTAARSGYVVLPSVVRPFEVNHAHPEHPPKDRPRRSAAEAPAGSARPRPDLGRAPGAVLNVVLGLLRGPASDRRALPAQSPAGARTLRNQVGTGRLERRSPPEPSLHRLRASWGGFAASGLDRCDRGREAVPRPADEAQSCGRLGRFY